VLRKNEKSTKIKFRPMLRVITGNIIRPSMRTMTSQTKLFANSLLAMIHYS
jgi:hypothetical protein